MRQQRYKGDSSYPDWLDKKAEDCGILPWFLRQDIRQNEKETINERGSEEDRRDPN